MNLLHADTEVIKKCKGFDQVPRDNTDIFFYQWMGFMTLYIFAEYELYCTTFVLYSARIQTGTVL